MTRLNGFATHPVLNPLGGPLFTVPPPTESREPAQPRLTNIENGRTMALPQILDAVQEFLPRPLVRVGNTLLARPPEGALIPITTSSQLVAFTGNFANIHWQRGAEFFTQEAFFEFAKQRVDQYAAVEHFPHEAAAPNILYHHQELPAPTGRFLPEFLNFFTLASPADRTLFESFVLSMCVCLPGGKPMFVLMNSSSSDNPVGVRDTGRGVGKSTAVALVAEVFGGLIEISSDSDEDRLRTRLLSDGATGKRLVRLDNVKSDRMSCAMIERLITAPEISGHRLYQGEGSRPNHFVYSMTVNGPNLSEDLASRSILIRCQRPAYDPGWEDRVHRFIAENRWNLISDIIARINSPSVSNIEQYGRFSSWEEKVIARCAGGNEALLETNTRRRSIDADLGDVQAIQDLLNQRSNQPSHHFTTREMCEIVREATGESRAANKLKTYLERNPVPGLVWRRGANGAIYTYTCPQHRCFGNQTQPTVPNNASATQ